MCRGPCACAGAAGVDVPLRTAVHLLGLQGWTCLAQLRPRVGRDMHFTTDATVRVEVCVGASVGPALSERGFVRGQVSSPVWKVTGSGDGRGVTVETGLPDPVPAPPVCLLAGCSACWGLSPVAEGERGAPQGLPCGG